MLKEGDPAPVFQLPADDGRNISLKDLQGKHVRTVFLSQGQPLRAAPPKPSSSANSKANSTSSTPSS